MVERGDSCDPFFGLVGAFLLICWGVLVVVCVRALGLSITRNCLRLDKDYSE